MTKRKRTNNDLQNITKKLDRVTQTPLKQGVNSCAPEGWEVSALLDVDFGDVYHICGGTERKLLKF
jgi:hypothetical protein